MRSDVALGWKAAAPIRATVCSRATALTVGGIIASLLFAAAAGSGTAIALCRKWPHTQLARRTLLPGIIVAVLAGAIWYGTREIVPVETSSRFHFARRLVFPIEAHQDTLADLLKTPPERAFPQAYPETLDGYMWKTARIPSNTLEEPGDYTIEPNGNGWTLTILDHDSVPVVVPISSNGQPYPP